MSSGVTPSGGGNTSMTLIAYSRKEGRKEDGRELILASFPPLGVEKEERRRRRRGVTGGDEWTYSKGDGTAVAHGHALRRPRIHGV